MTDQIAVSCSCSLMFFSRQLISVKQKNCFVKLSKVQIAKLCTDFVNVNMKARRGAFIVIEGLDRTGKTTQCKNLVANLLKKQVKVEYSNFPDRHTEIGTLIDSYLKSENDLSDEAIHLLFSANRWEKTKEIVQALEKGITVIVDRYCFSGVAFSAAKGLDLDWCKTPDIGLPKPDKVLFFTMPSDRIEDRKGFGNERYEVTTFQKTVGEMFLKLKDDSWDMVNADRPQEVIQNEIIEKVLDTVSEVGDKPLGKVWV